MKFFKHWSLRRKLFVATSLLILCSVLLVSSLFYSQYAKVFSKQSAQQVQQLIEQLVINTETYLDELFRLCLSPYYSKRIMNQLEYIPLNDQERLEKKRVIEDFLREMMTIPRNDILRVYILTDNIYSSTKTGHNLYFSSNFVDEPWYKEAVSSKEAVFIPVFTEKHGGYTLSVFSVVQQIRSLDNTNTVLGVIRVDANYAGIKAVCDKVSVMKNSALYIVDESNNIIYENSKLLDAVNVEEVYSTSRKYPSDTVFMSFDNKTYIMNSQQISSTGWMIIAVNSYSELTKNFIVTKNYTILLALLCSVIGVVIGVLFVRRSLYPLSKTVEVMRCVQNGDLTVRANADGTDEIAYLNQSFNEMLARIQSMMERDARLTKQVYEAKYLQKEAQYDALYNQMRPHFLFNTLNTISLLIKCGHEAEAITSIDELSLLLRGMINTDRDITLESELKIVESYLSLQKRRHDSLSYAINHDPALGGYMLPALTIQPLVENAFIHGCAPKHAVAFIRVSTRLNKEHLLISVEDDGIGMDKDQLDNLRENLETCDDAYMPSASRSIGLVNITRRIKLKFGDEYGLSITSELHRGTIVTVILPYERGVQNVQSVDR